MLAAFSAVVAERAQSGLAALGGLAVALVAVGVVGGSCGALLAGLIAIGAEYALSLLAGEGQSTLSAALFAALFLATAEFAYWSLELRARVARERGILARRLVDVSALTAGALAVAAALLTLAASAPAPRLELEALGVAAALAVFALAALAARSRRG